MRSSSAARNHTQQRTQSAHIWEPAHIAHRSTRQESYSSRPCAEKSPGFTVRSLCLPTLGFGSGQALATGLVAAHAVELGEGLEQTLNEALLGGAHPHAGVVVLLVGLVLAIGVADLALEVPLLGLVELEKASPVASVGRGRVSACARRLCVRAWVLGCVRVSIVYASVCTRGNVRVVYAMEWGIRWPRCSCTMDTACPGGINSAAKLTADRDATSPDGRACRRPASTSPSPKKQGPKTRPATTTIRENDENNRTSRLN